MFRVFKNVFLIAFPLFVLYCTLYYLFNQSPLENPLQYFLNQLSNLGDVNIWVHLTEYWNTEFLPAWTALTQPEGFFEAIGAFFSFLFELLLAPLRLVVIFLGDIFGLLTTVFGFLNFSS